MNGGIVVYVSIRMSKQWEIDVNLYSLIFKIKKFIIKINILLPIDVVNLSKETFAFIVTNLIYNL